MPNKALDELSTCLGDLNKRIAGHSGDSTLIVLVPRHHNVTFHSPLSPPGVFDQPVVLALVSSITNNKYGMVQQRAFAGPEIINKTREVCELLAGIRF